MSMFPQTDRRPVELEYGTTERSMSNFFNAVYAWMAVGLAVTAVVAWGASQSRAIVELMYGSKVMLVAMPIGMLLIAIATQNIAMRMSAAAGTAMFLVYATLMGLFICGIFLIYRIQTLGVAFLLTGGVFGLMSVYGYITKRDLTTIGSLCVMGMLGIFLASLVNIFVASNALSWVVTYGVLLLTLGIVAYKTQQLKEMAIQFEGNREMLTRLSIVGSLILYISFINLFLSILRILGNRR